MTWGKLVLFALLLLAGIGCASDGDKGQWDEFWKDLRGENMEMRTGPWATQDSDRSMR